MYCSLILHFPEHAGYAGGQVELEPTFVVASQMVVIDGVVDEFIIIESIATKLDRIGVEEVLVGTLLHHEAIACVTVVRAEIEEEKQVSTANCKHLVSIVVPDFCHCLFLEALELLEELNHGLIEVAQIVIAEFLIIDKVPLATCILVAPSVAFAREVNPLGMSELVALYDIPCG